MGADLSEFAASEFAEVVSGRDNFKTAAKSVGRQTLRKKFISDSRNRSESRVIPMKSAKQTNQSRGNISTNISQKSCGAFSGTNLLWQVLEILEGKLQESRMSQE